MNCPCCLSDLISTRPLHLPAHFICKHCGLIFSPKGGYQAVKAFIGDHYERVDPHKNVAEAKQTFFSRALRQMGASTGKDKSILDVGCGYGYFLELAHRNGWRVRGVEIAEDAVRQSRRKLGEKNIFQGSLEQAGYETDFFDAVTLWDMLVFVEDPAIELGECLRILKKGGKIGVRVRNVSFQKMLYRILPSLQKCLLPVRHKKALCISPLLFQ